MGWVISKTGLNLYKFYCETVPNKISIARLFISDTFISNTRLKLAKNQAKAKQQLQVELLLSKNYPRYHPKVIGHTLINV